jgi:hypothetical protein
MRNTRLLRNRATVLLGCLLVAAAAAPVVAHAGTPRPAGGGTLVLWNDPHGQVRTAAADTGKDALMSAPVEHAAAPAATGTADRNQWLYPSGSAAITPPKGRPGTLQAAGSSYVYVPYLSYYAQFSQIHSKVAWLGASPLTADSIQHTDDLHVDFFGTGFSANGAPAGAVTTADGSSADVKWTTTVTGNWYSEHSWDKVTFMPASTFNELYRISHRVSGVFQFGSSFYTVTGEDKAFVW